MGQIERLTEWFQPPPQLEELVDAGGGPVLPLPLLCRANGLLGGPGTPVGVCDVLVRLRGLVVRGNPSTPDEHAGVFHDTLAHLAPSAKHDPSDPLPTTPPPARPSTCGH